MKAALKRPLILATAWLGLCLVAYRMAVSKANSGDIESLEQAGRIATLPAQPWFLLADASSPTWGLWSAYILNAGLLIMLDNRMRRRRGQSSNGPRRSNSTRLGGFGAMRPKFPDWDDD